MIVPSELLARLKDFGLNSYEAKLWTALLSRGVATAGELSDIANVPRSRSYDVLESLERKGFVIMKLGKPIKYIAVSPSEVVERVKKQVMEEAQIQTKIVDNLRGSPVLTELEGLYTQGIELVDPSEITGTVKGRNNLYGHLNSMIRNAQRTIYISTTEHGLIRKSQSLRAALQKARSRKIDVKVLAPVTKLNKPAVKGLAGAATVRNCSQTIGRFCLIDGKQAVLMVLDDKVHPSYDFGIWINSEFFTQSLRRAFTAAWAKA